ncbi:MAG TPA: mandelate racemase/muconate lactonizing enzyme family protein [Phycisphaerae bacterium]|nr:mandelate racemase/muconate lactonizing enzyme family protein [Phycisphaerae bacterium]HRY67124.1 mandelate racemase/muconate lactonizing enzyme family protein [Phycisphaerae bacterium]HSA26507.1 mandelate racemase/muconate lactonizing enzyme family protein [Phycisphaerae bacterium]
MEITKIECHVVVVPNVSPEACSSAQDDIVVLVHTDEGITGIGEVDTNPWVARAMIQAPGTHCMGLGLQEMLVGQNPLTPEALWDRMYLGSAMTGRRGLGICAMGALDMALWDIRGKAMGKPCWQLLGGAKQPFLTPYASLLPTGRTLEEYQRNLVHKAIQAKNAGFKAAKMEVCLRGPYSHNAIQESNEAIIETVAACREAVGPEMTMMVDVAYAWWDAKEALGVLERLEEYNLFFLETPLNIDDLDGYAFLAERAPFRIAAGEWQNTRFEFIDLMDRGRIDVAQPDVGRVGGLTEARRVADLAAVRGRLIVPHCWKTGIGVAASAHLAAATAHCPYIEYLPPELSESDLRKELADDGLKMDNGRVALPERPGLGIELNYDALGRYRA